MSMDLTAIKAIQQSQAVADVARQVSAVNIDRPIIALPSDIQLANVEQYFPTRRAHRGNMTTAMITSFVAFSDKSASDQAVCFVDPDGMKAVAIYDYENDEELPGHCIFTGNLQLKKTAEFVDFLDAVTRGKQWSQLDLAHFIEDNADMVTAKNSDGIAIDLAKAISAIRRITIDSKTTATHEVGDMRSARSALETIAANSNPMDTLPAFFEFMFVPYLGLRSRLFTARVVAHLNASEPKLTLKAVRLDQSKQDMAEEFAELLTDKLDGVIQNIYIGDFKAH